MGLCELRNLAIAGCRRLLSEANRDPYAPAYGCFDRRYWAWKLVDYPEATYQRGVYPLAWLLRDLGGSQPEAAQTLADAVRAGLAFSARIQHRDGSFDQAFPHEHSFGATAFLLHELLQAYRSVRDACSPAERERAEGCLRRAADFLRRHDETHGHIANHLAGAALGLLESAELFGDGRYERRAEALLGSILRHRSGEGWFLEYEGADPGYQTLALHYLAHVYRLRPTPALREALGQAVEFLAWFVHPDGTYGGEYGSRRTAIFYPGGFALLAREFPTARSVLRAMLAAIAERRTPTLESMDIGNVAPLLATYLAALDAHLPDEGLDGPPLPCEREDACQDFPAAGLFVRGTPAYYAVLGASNGGVLKVFDRPRRVPLWNDGGYVGQETGGAQVTTQATDLGRPCRASAAEITLQAPFYYAPRSLPTPARFVLLRLLNLTLMRSPRLGNWVKGLLVRRLITRKRPAPLSLTRSLRFEATQVVLTDVVRLARRRRLDWLEFGRPFVAIHMALSRYFENFPSAAMLWAGPSCPASSARRACPVDVAALLDSGEARTEVVISADRGPLVERWR